MNRVISNNGKHYLLDKDGLVINQYKTKKESLKARTKLLTEKLIAVDNSVKLKLIK